MEKLFGMMLLLTILISVVLFILIDTNLKIIEVESQLNSLEQQCKTTETDKQ